MTSTEISLEDHLAFAHDKQPTMLTACLGNVERFLYYSVRA
jgi:hypothetical protein